MTVPPALRILRRLRKLTLTPIKTISDQTGIPFGTVGHLLGGGHFINDIDSQRSRAIYGVLEAELVRLISTREAERPKFDEEAYDAKEKLRKIREVLEL